MTAPNCPDHGSPMRAGQKGGFYCPKKMPDGSYCAQRAKDAPQSPPAQPVPSGASPNPGAHTASPQAALALACLDFASRVFQGTAQGEDALALAGVAYARWKVTL